MVKGLISDTHARVQVGFKVNPAPSVDDILCLCSKRPLTADINEVQGVKWWFSMNEVKSLWAFVPPSSPDPFSNVTKNRLEQIILWIVRWHNLSLQLWRTEWRHTWTRWWGLPVTGDHVCCSLLLLNVQMGHQQVQPFIASSVQSHGLFYQIMFVVRDIYTTVFILSAALDTNPLISTFIYNFAGVTNGLSSYPRWFVAINKTLVSAASH